LEVIVSKLEHYRHLIHDTCMQQYLNLRQLQSYRSCLYSCGVATVVTTINHKIIIFIVHVSF